MTPPPYHLRLNKAVDRFLLIDLLRCFTKKELTRYTYVGLGGPFLEDFKLLDSFFPSLRKVSFETDSQAYLRQQFNRPNRLVRLEQGDIVEKLDDQFDDDKPLIVWYDSTQNSAQIFDGFVSLLDKVPNESVVRVTMRLCHKEQVPDARLIRSLTSALKIRLEELNCTDNDRQLLNEDIDRIVKERVESASADRYAFSSILRYLPTDYRKQLIQPNGVVRVLFQAIHRAAEEVFPAGCGRVFQLLNSSHYSDGTKMLSVTGVVLNESQTAEFMQRFKGTDFYNAKWSNDPVQIDMPVLTPKERLHLSKIIPVIAKPGERLRKRLGYSLEQNIKTSDSELEMYNRYYRYYPMFAKVAL